MTLREPGPALWAGPMDTTSEMSLAVPAQESFVRTIRLVTGDAAARAGFGVDQIDDVRLAVTELCYAVLAPQATRFVLCLKVYPGRIAVTGTVDGTHGATPDLDAIASVVVDVICDHCTLESTERTASFTFGIRAAG